TAGTTRIDNSGNGTFGGVTFNGSLFVPWKGVAGGGYTVGANDYYILDGTGGGNITLPPAASNPGRVLIISNYTGGAINLVAQGSDQILPAFAATASLGQGTSTTLVSYNGGGS